MLGVVVYLVLGCSIGECSHIGIVPIRQNPDPLLVKRLREKIIWPEDVWFVRGPSVVRMAVKAMDKYNTKISYQLLVNSLVRMNGLNSWIRA